jgi:hypothetical protein
MRNILSPIEVRKVCYSLAELCQICLFEFMLVKGCVKFVRHCKEGEGRKLYKFGTLWARLYKESENHRTSSTLCSYCEQLRAR